jgi:phosphoenolpyruvate carboxykinase (ATP)
MPDPFSPRQVFWNLSAPALLEKALQNRECYLTESGALMEDGQACSEPTSLETYFVKDESSAYEIWWAGPNKPVSPAVYGRLYAKMQAHLQTRDVYVRDAFACSNPVYRLPIRIITTKAYQCRFCQNMFLCPEGPQLDRFNPEYTILCAPEFAGDPAAADIPGKHFTLLNLQQKTILIAGKPNAGEIREAVYTLLHYLLPQQYGVLPLHGAVSEGHRGDTALFMGLPGAGKTTLAADPERNLIGREELGWDNYGVFTFAGSRFAKVLQLGRQQVPGREQPAPGSTFSFIPNFKAPALTGIPRHLFFLTADASGVLPLVSQLNPGQAMFHFLSGYSGGVGEEARPAFAACFGAPHMPLPPVQYAELLGRKIRENQVQVWLLNTGRRAGLPPGARQPLSLTRAIVRAVLANELEQVAFTRDPLFGLAIPRACPGVAQALLAPRACWTDKAGYEAQAHKLAWSFLRNFEKYKALATAEMRSGAPVIHQHLCLPIHTAAG